MGGSTAFNALIAGLRSVVNEPHPPLEEDVLGNFKVSDLPFGFAYFTRKTADTVI